MGRIRIGVFLPAVYQTKYQVIRDRVLRLEALGVDAIFGHDHFRPPVVAGVDTNGPILAPEQPQSPNFESWTTLAAWAERTERTQIGALVSNVDYRNPDLLADMARTVDHISAGASGTGRLILGLGAGWYENDYSEYGYDFGTPGSRAEFFVESLARIKHRLANLNPEPTRKIPILIGGGGEKEMLPAAAQHADIWHWLGDLESLRQKSALLDMHATRAGRDPAEIERCAYWPGARQARLYAEAGFTFFVVNLFGVPDPCGFGLTAVRKALAWRDAQNEGGRAYAHAGREIDFAAVRRLGDPMFSSN
ncbi:MAG: LLM class F420-dependent oxidoreductase [Segniliparus sp.]|uniref:LLM class F420-dependent oxidoreductase n=1 Tax=Segniliparus sp. TaxID=2804064 RepID=UPI003F3C0809